MKKYIPVDFDEKGNVILGNAKNNPTSNGFIPTTWAPGGGSDEGKNGIKSISISPAISTTPALESLFPIYYEDLTEDEKGTHKAVSAVATTTLVDGNEYAVTATPTDNMYVAYGSDVVSESAGAPITFNVTVEENELYFRIAAADTISAEPAMMFTANVDVYNE